MYTSAEYQKLEYHYEIVLARLELKEVFLKTIVQEVYENIGQILSLVRVQISLLSGQQEMKEANAPGELIGQAIRDLRGMCRSFYPETDLLIADNLFSSLQQEINRIYRHADGKLVKVTGKPVSMPHGTQLVLFRMLQEIVYGIKSSCSDDFLKVQLDYDDSNLNIIFQYRGSLIDFNSSVTPGTETQLLPRTPVPERIKVIDGIFNARKTRSGINQIRLTIPLNNSLYELSHTGSAS
jgi:glucose-6-phosphate-specific signal transduction histidine kinase